MSSSALIDDLERQFAENPRRVFARLANEYRKSGDPERAIAICRAHVPQQPGYISGYIVLGQALFDAGRQDEAQQAFQTALELDPENLIALRQLGDIAHQRGDLAVSREWYHRLLEVDPQNDEIAHLIGDIDATAQASYWSTPPERETPAPEASLGSVELESVDVAGAPEPFALGGYTLDSTWGADSLRGEEPPTEEFTPEPLEMNAAHEAPTPMADENIFASGSYFTPVEDVLQQQDADEAPGHSEAVADYAEESAERASEFEPEPAPVKGSGEYEEVNAGHEEVVESTGFVTETMAELYERQGFREQALEIYRQLVDQRPFDESLRERTAMLEAEIASAHAPPSYEQMQPSANGVHASWRSENARTFFGRIATRGVGLRRSDSVVAPEGSGLMSSFFADVPIGAADDAYGRSLAAAVAEGFGSSGEVLGSDQSSSSDEHFQAWLQQLKK